MIVPALTGWAYLLVYRARPFGTGKIELATGVLGTRCPSGSESLPPKGQRAKASFRGRSLYHRGHICWESRHG